jgi:hypothetical protein
MQAFGRVGGPQRRGNPYSQYGFKYPALETGYRDNSQPGFSQGTPPQGRNPYSDPGFSQGTTRPDTGGSWDRPRPAGKSAGMNPSGTDPTYGGQSIRPEGWESWAYQGGPSEREQAKRRRMYGTGGSGGIAGMQPRPLTQGNLFSEGADIKIQGESDYAVQNVRDRVWSFEDLRTAAEQPIFAAQNLGITQRAAQDALSRLMAQQMWGMGTGVTGGLDRRLNSKGW